MQLELTMALRSAYGFQPYSYSLRGLPTQPTGYGFGDLPENFDSSLLLEETVTSQARQRKPRPPKGRVAKCKIMLVNMFTGRGKRKRVRRRLCWDKHGTLVSNKSTRAKASSDSNRKVVCKRKCKNGGKAVCVGGYRKVKGKRVCKKFVCRKRG